MVEEVAAQRLDVFPALAQGRDGDGDDLEAIMISDTAPYRNPFYHTPGDRPETLDYARTARVVDGLVHVVRALAGGDSGEAATGG